MRKFKFFWKDFPMKNFSIIDSFKTGWQITHSNFLFLSGALLVTYLAHAIVMFLILTIKSISIGEFIRTTYPTLQSYFTNSFPFGGVKELGLFWFIVDSVIVQLFSVGLLIISINLYDRKSASLANFLRVFQNYRLLFNVIVAWLLSCIPIFLFSFLAMGITNYARIIPVFVVFIFFISSVFSLWFASRFGFVTFLIIDRLENFLKAFHSSFGNTLRKNIGLNSVSWISISTLESRNGKLFESQPFTWHWSMLWVIKRIFLTFNVKEKRNWGDFANHFLLVKNADRSNKWIYKNYKINQMY